MKKVISLALAAAMAVGMGVTAFAAAGTTVSDSTMNRSLGWCVSLNGATVSEDKIEFDDDVHAADEVKIKFPLDQGMFIEASDNKGPALVSGTKMSATDIRASKIAVRSQIKGGSKVIKDLALKNKDGLIELKFADEWVSTKDQDFEIFIYLTIDGKRMDDYGVTILGTFCNEEISVYGDYDYVDLANGYVAVAEEFVPKIEVDLGNGVSIFTKLFKDKKYYGTATRDDDDSALVVYSKYPDIDNVVILKTVGLNSTGDVVKLDTDYADYYVYDANMNYLGQATEMLPYSTRYYLANRKLDIIDDTADDDDDTWEPEDDDDDATNPIGGGDGDSNGNANANPGTGR